MSDKFNVLIGLCTECGHPNQMNWVLCDNCGARLPWAPAKVRRDINELSDAELSALCQTATAEPTKQGRIHTLRDILMRAVRGGFH